MQIFWIKCDNTSINEVIEKIENTKSPLKIYTPNPEILLRSTKNESFKNTLLNADLLLPDWIWLYVAYQALSDKNNKFLRTIKIPYYILNVLFNKKSLFKKYWTKIAWSDLTRILIEKYDKIWGNIAILDLSNDSDTKKVEAQKIMPKVLKEKYPNVNFTIIKYKEENFNNIVEEINKNGCEIVFCTLWMIKQEQLIEKILPLTNSKAGIWVWGSIDYLIWFQKRAPKWLREAGLEWLYRFFNYPNKKVAVSKVYNAIFTFTIEVIKRG